MLVKPGIKDGPQLVSASKASRWALC
jgi:hypothetical protein